MKIVAKSGVSYEQLLERERSGVEYLELHLNEKDIETSSTRRNILPKILPTGMIVKAVHSPISDKYNLESLNTEEGLKRIIKVFKLALLFSYTQETQVQVVLHNTIGLAQLKNWGIYERTVANLDYLLERFPGILISIENEALISLRNGQFRVSQGSDLNEIPDLCKQLREDLETDRIGTVLDICHALATIKQTQGIVDAGIKEQTTIQDYLTVNIPYLFTVHLSNSRGFGNDENHGTIFETEEEISVLNEILETLKKAKYKNLLTLEVQEKDYTDIRNYRYLRGSIEDYFSKS